MLGLRTIEIPQCTHILRTIEILQHAHILRMVATDLRIKNSFIWRFCEITFRLFAQSFNTLMTSSGGSRISQRWEHQHTNLPKFPKKTELKWKNLKGSGEGVAHSKFYYVDSPLTSEKKCWSYTVPNLEFHIRGTSIKKFGNCIKMKKIGPRG